MAVPPYIIVLIYVHWIRVPMVYVGKTGMHSTCWTETVMELSIETNSLMPPQVACFNATPTSRTGLRSVRTWNIVVR